MSIDATVELNNGVSIPQLGLGVFQMESGSETESAIRAALACGYRSIDTATVYGNEESVGNAIDSGGVPREELFVTTKVWNKDQGYQQTLDAFEASLKRLKLDYLDLYLIHWPVRDKYIDTWRALEKLYAEGRVRAIGVSNFHARHLEYLVRKGDVVPVVNQVELHPYMQQKELRCVCRELKIGVEAWSPIAKGKVTEDETLRRIGDRHGKTAVQVTLRWELQHGIITIPKSVHEDRIRANADVFDFSLSADEMAEIDALDLGEAGRTGPHPDAFNF